MKVISVIFEIIVTLVMLAVLACGFMKGYTTYTKAQYFNTLSNSEQLILRVIDNNKYEDYFKAYTIVSSLPIIGETL